MTNNFVKLLELESTERPGKKDACKGQIYRYTEEAWIGSDNDVNFRHRFRHVKSLSCNDIECSQCGWLLDDFQEQLGFLETGYGSRWRRLIDFDDMLPQNPTLGAYYQLKVIDWSADWESGVCDDWTIGFEEWNENENK